MISTATEADKSQIHDITARAGVLLLPRPPEQRSMHPHESFISARDMSTRQASKIFTSRVMI